ncbi:hypothetical protein OS190_01335 [Sulfitobacter sp. F26204]|uniref:hypothetical protein n=1 Tax=Sulfitobacter sp. F26204 TaxID=2996014 RepID=UPI00225E2071|nr:hypothetical protein [Sulfitobacter sp. F26204]MCX7558192.1 hypothetical protein [Sulfitobacter sp. F26204]
MTDSPFELPTYRTANLPGLGEVQIPLGISDAEVLAQVCGEDLNSGKNAEATPPKKTKKKP